MLSLLVLVVLGGAPASGGRLGKIDFKVSGPVACQKHFTEGMLSLHSFMYADAHAAFQAAGPHCPMAVWGDAMAYSHPIWGEVELDAARAALEKVSPDDLAAKRERDFLSAARALFGDGATDVRQRAWLVAARQMAHDYPQDDEVALQVALALLAPGNNDGGSNVRAMMESAAIALGVLQRHPNHPGAAHYAIHAWDSPDHAILALSAARIYASIAPAATHALHMPSHTFVQLGMWQDVARSNEASWGVDSEHAKSKPTPLGQRDLHSYSWLAAAYSELGEAKKANGLLTDLKSWLEKDDGPMARYSYVAMSRLLIGDENRWDEAEAWLAPLARPLPLENGESVGSLGCALHAPGSTGKVRPPVGLVAQAMRPVILAEAAMQRGDEEGVKQQNQELERWLPAFEPWKDILSKDFRERLALGEEASLAGARARAAKTPESWSRAIDALSKLAALSEGGGAQGPAFNPPARLLLAETELEAGRAREAQTDFDRVLELHPMMSRGLLGSARAAKAAGDANASKSRYAQLLGQWVNADPDLPELPEVRSGSTVASAP